MPPKETDAAAYATTSETDFYEILGVPADSILDSALRKAFRKQSLKWHPDKNPSPEAADKFHQLTIAYDVLSDPATRAAYDNARIARLAKKRRSEAFDLHRRKMQEDLESRENRAKRTKIDTDDEEAKFRVQLAKLQEEGAKLRHRREGALRQAAQDNEDQQQHEAEKSSDTASRFSELDRTVTVRWRRKGPGEKLDEAALLRLFARFGKIQDCIVKEGGKDKKYQNGLIVFDSIVGAHSAVRQTLDSEDEAFKVFKTVTWASGKEPGLNGESLLPPPMPERPSLPRVRGPPRALSTPMEWNPPAPVQKKDGPHCAPSFASFTSVAVGTPKDSPLSKSEAAQSPDYESITLMRMRDAEKRRLEAEVRKREENLTAREAP
jgi:DnaJ family protein C protein 17